MAGDKPSLHIKTKVEQQDQLTEVGVAWKKEAGFFSGFTKIDIPANTNFMVFIDQPKEPAPAAKKVRQSKKPAA